MTQDGWQDYGTAFGIIAVAVLARIVLDSLIPDQIPFITFFPAVVAAAYWCGFWPSVMVLGGSAVIGTMWVDPSVGSNAIASRALSLVLFGGLSGLNIYFVQKLKTATQHSAAHEEKLELINGELKHRIKNLFAIASTICQQTIKHGGTADVMTAAVRGRLHALAAAQDLLTVTSSEGTQLMALVDGLVKTLAPAPESLKLTGGPVLLPASATTPLILHELATNALKYGAWSGHGLVSISWAVIDDKLEFLWSEHDGPAIAPPIREGLGSLLIRRGLPEAKVEHDLQPDGLRCKIILPLAAT